jgi:hypothetical protein
VYHEGEGHWGAAICERGHIEADNVGIWANPKYCSRCGSRVLNRCEHCQDTIPPTSHGTLPGYCAECGEPYPWTVSAWADMVKTVELRAQLEKWDEDQIESTQEFMTEVASSKIGVERIEETVKDYGVRFGEASKGVLFEIVKSFVGDEIKTLLRQHGLAIP